MEADNVDQNLKSGYVFPNQISIKYLNSIVCLI